MQELRSVQDVAPGVSIASVRCLWACKRSCAVHLRSPGRAGYVLCDLEASESSARALLSYAAMYGESTDGAVPFKRWPDPLRGHFLCRTPPSPEHESSSRASNGTAPRTPLAGAAASDKDSP